jgi:hypothetical protein
MLHPFSRHKAFFRHGAILPSEKAVMESDSYFGWVVTTWIGSIILATSVASRYEGVEGGMSGFLLGVFFGPLGLIAAFAVDHRRRCPCCREHIFRGAQRCPHCHEPIEWQGDQPAIPDTSPAPLAGQKRNESL